MFRKLIYIIVVLGLYFILTACDANLTHNDKFLDNKYIEMYDNYDELYVFNGENTNWNARYTVKIKEASTINEFTLNYNWEIDELLDGKKLKYYYESSAGKGEQTVELRSGPLSENTFKIITLETGNDIVRKDETIRVVVQIDDEVEEFTLENEY